MEERALIVYGTPRCGVSQRKVRGGGLGGSLRSPTMESVRVPFLLICGPPGVGKSTVSWEVFDQLLAQEAKPALVDLDLLGACFSFPEDDPHNDRLKTLNLRCVWQNFQAVGSQCLIAEGVIDDRAVVDLYSGAIPGAEPTVCGLRAPSEELKSRIVRRGRDRGADLDKLTRRSVELADELDRNPIADFHVDTDELGIPDIARAVLAGAGGWPHLK
jgi:DNA polymerase III delta prime subunit